MPKCPSCAQEVPGESPSCPSCGAVADSSLLPARLRADERPRPAAAASGAGEVGRGAGVKASPGAGRPAASPDSIDEARFVPGYVLAGRYRVAGLLGRGGMGEVYRADDLTLKQPVALKLLPESLSGDAAALERFRREVRVARQISHPNVCRVYDIGEAGGLSFLSMEFIRGEELASVIKRFGRLPQAEAAEIARQICAGVAAAHKAGVLHRDLKPANVMIGAAGEARVTDFGLAAPAEEVGGDELAGTPAYMSPEQLAGRELTVRSDIYSLGLALYELYTGKRAFGARTLAVRLRLREAGAQPSSPSSHVKDLDPLVERVIRRCLEADPLVGRDLLLGSLLGAVNNVVSYVWTLTPGRLGLPPDAPFFSLWPQALFGVRGYLFPYLGDSWWSAVAFPLLLLFGLLLLLILLRREWLSTLAGWALLTCAVSLAGGGSAAVNLFFGGLAAALWVFRVMRFGLLALSAFSLITLAADFSVWYAPYAVLSLLLLAAPTLYGCYTSLGGQPLFSGSLLDRAESGR